MKKTVLICGVAAGLISTSWYIGTMILGIKMDHDFKNGMIYGYALMILAFSLIFVGTRITREKYMGGTISFGRAFLVGFWITLIASTVYVIVWLIDNYFFIPDFADKYAAHMVDSVKASGASQAEIAKETAAMENFKAMYKNPLFVILMTYVEILPVGLLVSLICALLLKKKKKEGVAPVLAR